MIVKIDNYGRNEENYFIEYVVSDLSSKQMDFLKDNLSEDCEVSDNILRIKMYFEERLYPFQSDIAKIKPEDFIAREEIEMNIFLSSFLEDM